jgi:hypothetical protein
MTQFWADGQDTAVRMVPGATRTAADQVPTAALPDAAVVVVERVDVVVVVMAPDVEGLELHAPANSAVRTSVTATAGVRPRI